MHIDFAMWRTAIWQLIKMDKKEEWEALDVVSKDSCKNNFRTLTTDLRRKL